MRLELMTSPAVAAYLGTRSGIIVPTGSTEQHGPDGLVGTDHLCAEAIARQFGERSGTIIAPTLAYGMSQFHLAFAGSVALRPSTLASMATDIVASLAASGFRRIYFLNGHGGNIAPLRSGIQEYYAALSLRGETGESVAHCRLRSWWELPSVDALRKSLYGGREGYHVTPSEVAITMAAHPEAIGPFERAPPETQEDAILHAGDNYYDAEDFRRRYPDGRVISDSALATRADGARLFNAAVEDLAQDFDCFCVSR